MPPSEHGSAGQILGVEKVYGGYAAFEPRQAFGPRRLLDYEVVLILASRAIYHRDGKEFPVSAGSIIFAQPTDHEAYACPDPKPVRHAFFHLSITHWPDDWRPARDWPVVRPPEQTALIRPLVRHVIDSWAQDARRDQAVPHGTRRMIEALLHGFMEPPDQATHRRLPFAEPVQRCLEWAGRMVEHHPHQPVSLDDLAAAASVSAKHLCRLFAQGPGISPMRAVRNMRLVKASRLLMRSNLNVQEIADRCGFASPFHFSRCFKELFGDSPRAARDRAMKGQPMPPPGEWTPAATVWPSDE